jgi:hypothetical protein
MSAMATSANRGTRSGIATLGLLAILLAGCLPSPSVTPSADFLGWLDNSALTFTPGDPPPGAIVVVDRLLGDRAPKLPGAHAEPIYGVLTCVQLGCSIPAPGGGTTAYTPPLEIWLVTFPNVPVGAGSAWSVFEAHTGQRISGALPPAP